MRQLGHFIDSIRGESYKSIYKVPVLFIWVRSLLALLVKLVQKYKKKSILKVPVLFTWARSLLALLALLVRSTKTDSEGAGVGRACDRGGDEHPDRKKVLNLLAIQVQKYKYWRSREDKGEPHEQGASFIYSLLTCFTSC